MFIEGNKFKKIREAAGSGDEKALAILHSFQNDCDDCQGLIDEYFKPIATSKPKIEVAGKVSEPNRGEMSALEKFLADNNISEGDDDYDEAIQDFEMITGKKPERKEPCPFDMQKLIDDELEAIEGYQKKILELANTNINEMVRTGLISKLEEIKNDEIRHINTLKELQKTL